MTEVNYDSQPLRPCLGCGKTDRAPRDVVGLPDGGTVYYHFDCHVLVQGCPVCKVVLMELGTEPTPKGLKNEKLLDKILDAGNPDTGPVPGIFTAENAREYALAKLAEEKK